MKLLALETTTEYCSVALLSTVSGELIFRHEFAPREQTRRILPMVDELLGESGWSLNELDAIAYANGPGAFTGVRIGASVAQGLAFGANLGMVGICSLQTLAQAASREHGVTDVMACFDARMGEIYAGVFHLVDGWMQPSAPVVVCKPDALPEAWLTTSLERVGVGSGWGSYGDVLAAQLPVSQQWPGLAPSAVDVAGLAGKYLASNPARAPEQALPVYLRDNVWKKLPGRQV
ncbi:MAG: tRNA (adenosine(37)-N6)-threonylcarbamoyltransferase complex dimerization subunit type 1 TsaB [Paraperlucidibaca sp.]